MTEASGVGPLIGLLATLPATDWAGTIHRWAVLDRVFADGGPKGAIVRRLADELEVDTRTVHRLIAERRRLLDGGTPRTRTRGRHAHVDPRVAAVVDASVLTLGRDASDADVARHATEACRRQGLPDPSSSAIRLRTRGTPGTTDLRRRLRRDFDVSIDACPLDLDVESTDGTTGRAVLVTVQDGADGSILSHLLTQGIPDAARCAALLASSFTGARRPGAEPATIVRTSRLAEAMAPLGGALAACGLVLIDTASHGPRTGGAILPTLGLRLGRLRLLPHAPVAPITGDPVPINVARSVVDLLLGRLPRSATTGPSDARTTGRVDAIGLVAMTRWHR